MDFTTQISGHDVTILNITDTDKDYDINGSFTIEWQFYTEMRGWGVKDIGVYATKVSGEIDINYLEGNDCKYSDVETQEMDSDDEGWALDTDMDHYLEFHWGGGLKPQDLIIDFKDKTIRVVF